MWVGMGVGMGVTAVIGSMSYRGGASARGDMGRLHGRERGWLHYLGLCNYLAMSCGPHLDCALGRCLDCRIARGVWVPATSAACPYTIPCANPSPNGSTALPYVLAAGGRAGGREGGCKTALF